MRLLIATWGEPSTWGKVLYKFEGQEDYNCSTLSLLRRTLNPDRTILVVTDTLVGKNRSLNSKCGDGKVSSLNFEGKSYDEAVNFVREYIREHLKLFNTSVEDIWVLPSVGYFPNITAKGEVSDLRYTLFVEFFKNFDLFLEDDNLEIYLDITHGQNFLPTLTYEVLDTVLGILAFFVKNIKLIVLNSDPFIFAAKPPFLEIHRVLERKIKPKPYLYYTDRFNFISSVNGENISEKLKRINTIKNEIPLKLKEKVPAFLGAIYNALPLMVFYTYLNPSYVEKLIDTVMEIYKGEISIEEDGGKLLLTRGLKLSPEMEVFAIYGMFLKGLHKKFSYLDEIAYFKTKKEIKVPFELLKEIAEGFLSYNSRNKAILEKEIGDLERITEKYLEEKGEFDWKSYREIKSEILKDKHRNEKKGDLKGKDNLIMGNEERNFLAHGGLSENSIQLKSENGKVFLKYVTKEENKDINIFEWSREGLEKI